jgi:hypothetical protein
MPAEEIDGATDARDRIKLFFKVKEDTWAALRPAFRKLWIAAVIFGTCVAVHD